MYKGYVVDASLLSDDPHLSQGCVTCHKGDDQAKDRAKAHAGFEKKPSNDLETCSPCHEDIAKNYSRSLHFTTAGFKNGVSPRFSPMEAKTFDSKVFMQSCNSCHATCGDCHVKSPTISGVSTGLLAGHKFVRRDDAKTCALCHGGRVYPEFTGDYGGNADVHYQKGMTCTDCHKPLELPGKNPRKEGRHRFGDLRCPAQPLGHSPAQHEEANRPDP